MATTPFSGASSARSQRLAGFELMRGFAAFGVICVHAGLVNGNRISAAGAALQAWFDFVVPFFLVTSFYFALAGERSRETAWGEWLLQRAARLLVPFLVWGAIYLGLHVLKLRLGHQAIGPLFHDPVSLLLGGGSSLALYFLPLLFVGLVVARAARPALLSAPVAALAATLAGAVALSLVVDVTKNGYDFDTCMAFQKLLPRLNDFAPTRILLVLLADAVRCLPFVVLAALFARTPGMPRRRAPGLVRAVGVVALAIPVATHLLGIDPVYLPQVIAGGGAFLVAWVLPVAPGRFVSAVGGYSFGVYLVHQLVLEAMQLALRGKVAHTLVLGFFEVLAVGLVAYAVSMAIVAGADRGGPFLRRLFALR